MFGNERGGGSGAKTVQDVERPGQGSRRADLKERQCAFVRSIQRVPRLGCLLPSAIELQGHRAGRAGRCVMPFP